MKYLGHGLIVNNFGQWSSRWGLYWNTSNPTPECELNGTEFYDSWVWYWVLWQLSLSDMFVYLYTFIVATCMEQHIHRACTLGLLLNTVIAIVKMVAVLTKSKTELEGSISFWVHNVVYTRKWCNYIMLTVGLPTSRPFAWEMCHVAYQREMKDTCKCLRLVQNVRVEGSNADDLYLPTMLALFDFIQNEILIPEANIPPKHLACRISLKCLELSC